MFDSGRVVAEFDELSERRDPSETPKSADLVEQVCVLARVENRAAAAQLGAIGELFAYRLSRCSQTEDWAVDTEEAVAAEVAAALRIGQGLAASRVRYARAMRERLPRVGGVFMAGDLDFRSFATIVYRTGLITDPDVLAAVDAELASKVRRWPSMSRGRMAGAVDRIVTRADKDAVRQRRQQQAGREVLIDDRVGGLSEIQGSVLTPHAHALDRRLSALAATVCAQDPRTHAQRRADALGALACGADRLGCGCGRTDCAAGPRRGASPVVIHVIAEQTALDGRQETPGSLVAADGLIGPELLADLAASATLVSVVHPADAPPEPGYVPSKALADFVRCRDLTCRWPGCDAPAWSCDVDHTIPYAAGGPTHASNLKCYCRTHHLVKTFWGWREQQLPDATLILTSPVGQHTYITIPGSALLFPTLAVPTGELPAAATVPADYWGERTTMMPTRRRTRAQSRAARIATERNHNRMTREAHQSVCGTCGPGPGDAAGDGEPPPF